MKRLPFYGLGLDILSIFILGLGLDISSIFLLLGVRVRHSKHIYAFGAF